MVALLRIYRMLKSAMIGDGWRVKKMVLRAQIINQSDSGGVYHFAPPKACSRKLCTSSHYLR